MIKIAVTWSCGITETYTTEQLGVPKSWKFAHKPEPVPEYWGSCLSEKEAEKLA